MLYMLLSSFAFSGMGVFVKLAHDVPLAEKVFFRNLVALFISLALALRTGRSLFGRRENQKLLMGRALLGLGGVVTFFYALGHLLLVDADMLNKLSPFFVAIFAGLFLGERPSRVYPLALVVAFGGAMLIIKPTFELTLLPALVGLASAAFAGGAYTVVRALKNREGAETIVFYFSFVSSLLSLPFVVRDFVPLTAAQWGALAGIGVSAAVGQIWLTLAYACGPAAEVSIVMYTSILFSAVFGFVFWGEIPDAWSLLGGVMIIGAALLLFGIASRVARPSAIPEKARDS
ncbi:MAG: DMT family transporter [Myxococcales bacterium]|nr:MAG: DMT family transporter [Myxococcales bacterium]